MMKWEYLVDSDLLVLFNDRLNKRGKDGWELIGITQDSDGLYTCVFKRPIA